jgi:hypothetical protein
VVRSKLPPDALTPTVTSTQRKLNPAQPATVFRPVQTLVDHVVSPLRFFVLLVSSFAGLAGSGDSRDLRRYLYSVAWQTQEIGIRMALGATAERARFDVFPKTVSRGHDWGCAGCGCVVCRRQEDFICPFFNRGADPRYVRCHDCHADRRGAARRISSGKDALPASSR